jgi:hypothetical protein
MPLNKILQHSMKSLTRVLILGTILFSTITSKAQYYYYNDKYYDKDLIFEVGASYGTMNCLTDVGGKKGFGPGAVNWKYSQPAAGFFVGAMYRNFIGARLEATWGKVSAGDLYGTAPQRNIVFRSDINEIALLAEFHPLMLKYYEDELPKLSPYVVAGVGWFGFNTQYKISNGNGTYRWVDTKPLHLEGQGIKGLTTQENYNSSQTNIPFGGGIRYELSQLFTLRGEFVYRKLFTDYLDDVSGVTVDPASFSTFLSPVNAAVAQQIYNNASVTGAGEVRGNPKTNDAYFSFNLKLSINLGRQRIH